MIDSFGHGALPDSAEQASTGIDSNKEIFFYIVQTRLDGLVVWLSLREDLIYPLERGELWQAPGSNPGQARTV